jgi:hypothetical protein
MTGLNHTLVGAAVALTFKNPILIAPIALASHFVCDALPHFGDHPKLKPYNSAFMKYLRIEALLCIAALLFAIALSPTNWFILGLGAAFATLPDFLWPFQHKFPRWTAPFYRFHTVIQWGERSYGWTYEIVYASLLIWLIVVLA